MPIIIAVESRTVDRTTIANINIFFQKVTVDKREISPS